MLSYVWVQRKYSAAAIKTIPLKIIVVFKILRHLEIKE